VNYSDASFSLETLISLNPFNPLFKKYQLKPFFKCFCYQTLITLVRSAVFVSAFDNSDYSLATSSKRSFLLTHFNETKQNLQHDLLKSIFYTLWSAKSLHVLIISSSASFVDDDCFSGNVHLIFDDLSDHIGDG
jgi:hypothetical protein